MKIIAQHRALVAFAVAGMTVAGAEAQTQTPAVAWEWHPAKEIAEAVPPLPPPSTYPVQLVLDDDTSDGAFGVAGQTARQFLWFNRFSPAAGFHLDEVWVLFPAGANMAPGGAIQIAIYEDPDGDPTNGANLLSSFAATIQAADDNTFSIYAVPGSPTIPAGSDLLVGVVPRFIVSGATPPTFPAALDTTTTQSRSWVAAWSSDPPDPPVLVPVPDQTLALVDDFLPGGGNFMIRAFGTPQPVTEVPTLGGIGLGMLVLLLAAAALRLLRKGAFAALLSGLAMLSASTPLSAVTIDSFTTNQAVVSDPPGTGSSVTGGADIIGTRRGLVPNLLLGAGPATASVAGGSLVLTVTATTPDSRGEVLVSWDGDTNPTVLSPTGLGNVNLTASNASGFRLDFASTTVVTEVEITVYDDAANYSHAARRVPVSPSAQTILVPFAEFRVAGGTGADFSSVGAIEMTLRSGEGTATLNEITTTAPAVAGTKVDTHLVDTDGDTRVDPGDRVRYTVTVTNTGNEALAVDLSDTVDANTTLVAGSVSSTPLAHADQYGWYGNVTFSTDGSAAKPNLLDNDEDADGDTLTVQSVTFPATTAAGGALTLVDAATGEFSYSPPAGFSGVDSFNYTIVDDNGNTSTASANITLDGVVWFVDDSNTTAPFLGTLADPFQSLAAVNGAGDADLPGDTIFVFDDNGTPYAGGLVLEADETLLGEAAGLVLGAVTIVPVGGTPQITNAAGAGITLATNNTLRGFDVSGTSGFKIAGSAFGTLTLDTVNLTGGGGALDLDNGVLAATFGTIASTSGTNGVDFDTVTGAFATTSTSVSGISGTAIRIVNGASSATYSFGATTITAPAGVDITASTTTSTSFTSLAVTATAGKGINAFNGGTINIAGAGNTVTATGTAGINAAALDISFTSLGSGATFASASSTTSGSSGNGINLTSVTGPVTINGGSITGAVGTAFRVQGGGGNISYSGSITNTTGAAVDITSRTGGTVTLSGNINDTGSGIIVASCNLGGSPTINFSGSTKSLSTGTFDAVTLSNNSSATINFTGGGLDIDTTSGVGFNATAGAAAIAVQGTGNTITSTTGTALNVANSTIGASDLTFQSISSNGGSSGIVLNTTGSTGNLVVTGTGAPGSGGTIQNKATGISLTSTSAPSFSWMQLNGFSDFAIRGSSVVGFNLDNTVINGTSGDAVNEGSVRFTGLTGSATVTNCNISGASENNFTVVNTSGSLNRITFSGATIGSNSNGLGSDGLFVEAQGSAVINVTVQNSFFTSSRGDLLQFTQGSSGSMDAVITGTAFSDNHPAIVAGGGGVNIGATAGSMTFNVNGNTFRDSTGAAFAVSCGNAGVSCVGRIESNVVGVAALPNSGSTSASGIAVVNSGGGTVTALVNNNQIRQYNNHGILLQSGQTLGNPTAFSVTVTNNSIANPGNINTDFNGIHLNNGTVPGENHTSCVDIRTNSIAGSGSGVTPPNNADYRLRQRQSTTVRLPGYGGANNNDAAVVAFVSGNQTTVTTGASSNTVGSGGGGFTGGAACPTPP